MKPRQLGLMLVCALLFTLPILALAQDTPQLDETIEIPEAEFSIDYPSIWDMSEEDGGFTLSSPDFGALIVVAYIPPDEFERTANSDLEMLHESLGEVGFAGGDPQFLTVSGQAALRSSGDSPEFGAYIITLLMEAPTDGAVAMIAVIFSDFDRNEAVFDAMQDTIRFSGSADPDTDNTPVVREANPPALTARFDVPELGFAVDYPGDWAIERYDHLLIYVLAANSADLTVQDPSDLRATLVYVEDYDGDSSELVAQFLGDGFYYSTRLEEVINAGGSPGTRLRGVVANGSTYRTLAMIELTAGDAYALIVDGPVRSKPEIVALSDAMLESVQVDDARTEQPPDDDPETVYELSESFEIASAGFRMRYPEGWVREEDAAGIYSFAASAEVLAANVLDEPILLIFYATPADYESFGGTLEDFGSILFGLINARNYESDSVDGREALRVSGNFVGSSGYGIGLVFNGSDGGGLLVLGAIGNGREAELEALFSAIQDTMRITEGGV